MANAQQTYALRRKSAESFGGDGCPLKDCEAALELARDDEEFALQILRFMLYAPRRAPDPILRQRSVEALLQMLRDIDNDGAARVDQNELDSDVFEVRKHGFHVGFVRIDDEGRLLDWI
jgi:hypothetical protein